MSRQSAKLAEFYGFIFGRNVWPADALGSRAIETGNPAGISGGIWRTPQEGHSMLQLFIRVDDVEAY